MANRTTAKNNIDTKNVPSVTNAIMSDMLKGDIMDNVVFREDVAAVQSSTVTNITVDFTSKDRVNLTRYGGTLNITLAGMGDGEIKWLLITKSVGSVIAFTNVVDITPNLSAENSTTPLDVVLYEIARKGSLYIAKAWNNTVISGFGQGRFPVNQAALSANSRVLTGASGLITKPVNDHWIKFPSSNDTMTYTHNLNIPTANQLIFISVIGSEASAAFINAYSPVDFSVVNAGGGAVGDFVCVHIHDTRYD